ncbi:MAG: NAD(P)/FAD-dependent oxidoreductase, partial [Candidatus Nanopelagicales bacterium]
MSQASEQIKQKILIVGAGFGGLTAASALAKKGNVEITVIDRHSYQLFSPLLYQVATGGLPEDDIAYPVRAAIPGVEFIRGEVIKVSFQANNIRLEDGRVLYFDQLVFAVGSMGTTFGLPGVEENALQMKSLHEARAIRNRLLRTYEDVETGAKPKEALWVVVVGGGPTGVEISGAVAELQKSMHREFPKIAENASVTLVEAGPRLLPSFGEKSSGRAKGDLEDLGVHVKVDSSVDRMYPSDVHLKSGEVLPAGTIIWAAGVAAPAEWNDLGETDRSNRLVVSDTLRLQSNVWVVGDVAHVAAEGKRPLPMVASVAMQQGRYVASSIEKILGGQELKPFTYKDKGQMATIGRRRAVVELPNG